MIKRLLVTGYKAHELGIFNEKHPGIAYIKRTLRRHFITLIEEGLEWVIISGQLGIELWSAEVIYDIKSDYPDVQLAVLTPYLDQEKKWPEEKQEMYQSILGKADFSSSITKRPYEGPWQFRAKNQFLLDHTDGMLIIYDDDKEGSPCYLMKEARKRMEDEDYHLIQITAYDLQQMVEEEEWDAP